MLERPIQRYEPDGAKFQLICRAGVTQGMENHIRKFCVPLEPVKSILNHLCLTGPSISQRNHEIMILILAAKETFLLFLCLSPLSQDIGKRFRDPHFPDASLRLGGLLGEYSHFG